MKSVILFLWVIIGAATGAIAAVTYSVKQAAQVPNWYEAQPQSRAAVQTPVQAPESQPIPPGAVALNSQDVNQLLTQAIADIPATREMLESSEGLNTTIEDGKLKGGMVVDLSQLPLEDLGVGEQALLGRAIEAFPDLANREIFVGIEGSPTIEAGQIHLNDQVVVKVGNLSLPLSRVAQQFGVSIEDLEQQLNQELRSRGINPETLQIVGDRIIIQGE